MVGKGTPSPANGFELRSWDGTLPLSYDSPPLSSTPSWLQVNRTKAVAKIPSLEVDSSDGLDALIVVPNASSVPTARKTGPATSFDSVVPNPSNSGPGQSISSVLHPANAHFILPLWNRDGLPADACVIFQPNRSISMRPESVLPTFALFGPDMDQEEVRGNKLKRLPDLLPCFECNCSIGRKTTDVPGDSGDISQGPVLELKVCLFGV